MEVFCIGKIVLSIDVFESYIDFVGVEKAISWQLLHRTAPYITANVLHN